MTIPTSKHQIHAEDLPYAAPEEEFCELVAGNVVCEPPPGETHGWITVNVLSLLGPFVRTRRLGRVYAESGFVLARDPDTVRASDAAFVSTERLAAGTGLRGAPRGPYFEGAPDLAVEVLSPSNSPAAVAHKVRDFLAAGTLAVWVINPEDRTLTIHRRDQVPQRLAGSDTLDAGPVLPGLRFRVGEIFEPWV